MGNLTTLHLPSGPLTIEQTPPTGALLVDPISNHFSSLDAPRRESQIRVESALARLPLATREFHLRVVEGKLSAAADLALALLALGRNDLAVRSVAELSLGGELRPARGFFSFARYAAQAPRPQLITAEGPDARHAAALLGEGVVSVASSLEEVLNGETRVVRSARSPDYEPPTVSSALGRRLLLTVSSQPLRRLYSTDVEYRPIRSVLCANRGMCC